MKRFIGVTEVYLHRDPLDFRKSINGLSVIFEEGERDPGEGLKLQLEALNQFTEDEKKVAKQLLDSLILQHTANQLAANK